MSHRDSTADAVISDSVIPNHVIPAQAGIQGLANSTPSPAKPRSPAWWLLATALLAGCAAKQPPSYVVLLPDAQGKVGQVTVEGQKGRQTLTQPLQGSDLDGGRPPYPVPREQVQRDFGAALAAKPQPPEQFLLYFEPGGAELTAESKALLPRIVERARARAAADLSVIGHTDTQGRPEANEALGLQRANAVTQLLRGQGLSEAVISVESHGARNLLVPTPENTAEPRNRRVEITVR
ncbi:OmpA family protein [Ramlibacter sp.]|uniref:OmpA family protein n=1 Tax=Ramlibacter sp. TaxID=1917967 RepID=UPI0035B22755